MEYLTPIASQGVLGALLVVMMLAIAFLYRELRSQQERRIDDLTRSRDAIIEPLEKMQQTAEYTLTTMQTLSDLLRDRGRRRP